MKKFLLSHLVKMGIAELQSDDRIVAEKEVNAELTKRFGDDWDILPISSVQSMIAIFAMNKILTPYGITPRKISELGLSKAKELELDGRSMDFLDDVVNTGELTQVKAKKFLEASESAGKSAFGFMDDLFTVSKDKTTKTVSKGVKSVKKLFNKD